MKSLKFVSLYLIALLSLKSSTPDFCLVVVIQSYTAICVPMVLVGQVSVCFKQLNVFVNFGSGQVSAADIALSVGSI